jgi:hypothetical protein
MLGRKSKTKKTTFWYRTCSNPLNNRKCIKTIVYESIEGYNRAIKRNSVCASCTSYGRKASKETKIKQGKSRKKYLLENPKANSGKNNPMYGKCSYKVWLEKYGKEEADKRDRIRRKKTGRATKISRINKRIKDNNFIWPNYNSDACKIIDKYGKENDYNFQHALNGGEIRIGQYWVDGYDKENNVVIEYYEKHHYKNNKLNKNTINRENDIIEQSNCKLIRINGLNKNNINYEIINKCYH